MSTMGIMILLFGISIGVATFIENDFGTQTAKAVVYNHRWFEILLGLLTLNMVVVIFTHKLYRREKIVNLVFHLAFILVLIGAAVTRFIGYEGVMHIRESAASNTFISERAYVSVLIKDGEDEIEEDKKVLFSRPMKVLGLFEAAGADFDRNYKLQNGERVEISVAEYIPAAEYRVASDPNAGPVLEIVTTEDGQRSNQFLVEGEPVNIGGRFFTLNDATAEGYIHVVQSDSGLVLKSPSSGRFMRMLDQSFGEIPEGEWIKFLPRQLYVIGSTNFVLSEYHAHARLDLHSSEEVNSTLADVVRFRVSKGDEERIITVGGGRGILQRESTTTIDGTEISIAYGSLMLQLPLSDVHVVWILMMNGDLLDIFESTAKGPAPY